jgi:hypothetical protein
MLGISYKALLYKVRAFGLDTDRVGKRSAKLAAPVKEKVESEADSELLAPAGRTR